MLKPKPSKPQLPEGKVVAKIDIPRAYPRGIAVLKDNLWIINSKDRELLKIDAKTKKIVDSLKISVRNPRGLAWDGEYFWCCDDNTKKVHQIDPSNGKIVRSLEVPIYGRKESAVLEAVAWDKKYLWVAYAAGYSSRIHRINVKTGEVIQSMFAKCHPKGLATDGNRRLL